MPTVLIKTRQTWERNPRASYSWIRSSLLERQHLFWVQIPLRGSGEVLEKLSPLPAKVFSGHGGANGLRDVPPLLGVESSTWKAAVNTRIPVIRKSAIPKVNLAKETFPASELEEALEGEMPLFTGDLQYADQLPWQKSAF